MSSLLIDEIDCGESALLFLNKLLSKLAERKILLFNVFSNFAAKEIKGYDIYMA